MKHHDHIESFILKAGVLWVKARVEKKESIWIKNDKPQFDDVPFPERTVASMVEALFSNGNVEEVDVRIGGKKAWLNVERDDLTTVNADLIEKLQDSEFEDKLNDGFRAKLTLEYKIKPRSRS